MKYKTVALALVSLIVLAVIVTLLFQGPVVFVPGDLYACTTDTDCVLINQDVVRQDCCAWDAINVKYEEWYREKMQEMTCTTTCSILLPTEAVCDNNICKEKQGGRIL